MAVNSNILVKGTVNGAVSKAQSVIVKELTFNNRVEVPSTGKKDMLYIATDEKALYIFDEAQNVYHCVGRDCNDNSAICVKWEYL